MWDGIRSTSDVTQDRKTAASGLGDACLSNLVFPRVPREPGAHSDLLRTRIHLLSRSALAGGARVVAWRHRDGCGWLRIQPHPLLLITPVSQDTRWILTSGSLGAPPGPKALGEAPGHKCSLTFPTWILSPCD